jgi:hypothetical protein
MITFESIEKNDDHVNVLYDLLVSRDEAQNISHQSKPDFEDHKKFVFNHPYRAWYLVKKDGRYIGNVNILESNTIGLYIPSSENDAIKRSIDFVKENYEPLPPIKSIRQSQFIINVAIHNKDLGDVISSLGGQAVQTTYVV